MAKRKPKYSGVLAKPMRLYSVTDLGMAAGITQKEAHRRNHEIFGERVRALRQHYGLTKNDSDWVLIILMGRDLGVPGCKKVAQRRNRKDAVELEEQIELIAVLGELMDKGKTITQASLKLARQRDPKASLEQRKRAAATLRTRYHELVRKWGHEQVERLKRYWL